MKHGTPPAGIIRFDLLLSMLAGAAVVLALQALIPRPEQGAVTTELVPRSVATVGSQVITVEQFQARLGRETGLEPSEVPLADRKVIIQQMVEERLLHRYLEQTGVIHADAALSEAIQVAAASSLRGVLQYEPPAAEELARFYAEQGAQFRKPSRSALERMVFRGSDARQQAELAHLRLQDGESFVSVKAQLAGPDLLRIPAEPLSALAWAEHLEGDVAKAIANQPREYFTPPLETEGGYAILRVTHTEPARRPPLEEVRAEVVRAYDVNRQHLALRALLADLMEQQTIVFNERLVETLESGD